MAQHERNLKTPPNDAVSLSVLTYNVALLDVRPFEKRLGGASAGRALSGLLEAQAGATLESPDLSARRAVLPEAILRSGKDIIMLQEVWNPEDVERFTRAAEAKGYVALVTPRDQHTDGLMTLLKKDLIDPRQGGIEQRAVTYEQQETDQKDTGRVGQARISGSALSAPGPRRHSRRQNLAGRPGLPEHWRERAAQMRHTRVADARRSAPATSFLAAATSTPARTTRRTPRPRRTATESAIGTRTVCRTGC